MMAPKLYRASMVCEVTGIKPVTLRQWHNRGVYAPETEEIVEIADFAEGLGGMPEDWKRAAATISRAELQGWRLYTLGDMIRIAVALHLIELGVRTERAGAIAKRVPVEGEIEDPRKVVISGGRAETMRRPAVPFVVALEPVDWSDSEYDGAEEQALDNTIVPLYGPEGLARAFTETDTDDCVYESIRHFETGIVINVAAITRQVKARLEKASAEEVL